MAIRAGGAMPAARAAGFTLVELVAVIVLLSILGVVVMARLPSPNLFAPALLSQALVAEARVARQVAAARHDAVVTLSVSADPAGWRVELVSDVDGILRNQLVEASDTAIVASSGSASATLDATTPVSLTFDRAGRLSGVTIGGAAGAPALGLALTVSGVGDREICVYPSGYASGSACV